MLVECKLIGVSFMFHSYNTRIKDSLHLDLFASFMGQRLTK